MTQLICTPFSYIISAVNSWTGNYFIALLAFTVVMKLVLFPLSVKQQKNTVRQAKLRPREEAIRQKYAGRNDKPTQQKMQQEIMEMYQEEKYSPLSGCLPLLLQLPVLLILYNIVQAPLQYTARYTDKEIFTLNKSLAIVEYYNDRAEGVENPAEFSLQKTEDGGYLFRDPKTGKDFYFAYNAEEKSGMFYLKDGTKDGADLGGIYAYPTMEGTDGFGAQPSSIVTPIRKNETNIKAAYGAFTSVEEAEGLNIQERVPNFEFFNGAIDLGERPTVAWNPLLIIPILTFITSYLSQWIIRKFTYQAPAAAEAQGSMRMMNIMMPLMSVWISFNVSAALAVYWIIQNLIAPIQQIILAKCWPAPKYSDEELKKLKNEYIAKSKGKTEKKSIPAPKRRSLVYDDEDVPAIEPEENKEEKKPSGDSPIGKADLK